MARSHNTIRRTYHMTPKTCDTQTFFDLVCSQAAEASAISTSSCPELFLDALEDPSPTFERGVFLLLRRGVEPRGSSNLKSSARKSFHIRGVVERRGSSLLPAEAVGPASISSILASPEPSKLDENFLSCCPRAADFLVPGLKKPGDPDGSSVGENKGDGKFVSPGNDIGSGDFSSLSASFASKSRNVGLSIVIALAEPLLLRVLLPDGKTPTAPSNPCK